MITNFFFQKQNQAPPITHPIGCKPSNRNNMHNEFIVAVIIFGSHFTDVEIRSMFWKLFGCRKIDLKIMLVSPLALSQYNI